MEIFEYLDQTFENIWCTCSAFHITCVLFELFPRRGNEVSVKFKLQQSFIF